MQLWFLNAHYELGIVLIFFIYIITRYYDAGAIDTGVWKRVPWRREVKAPVQVTE